MFDWSDLRHFLAVARTGSTLAAARFLRVSQPTVVRRIGALEAALGLILFDRRPSGYRLTRDAQPLVAIAEQAEAVATRFFEAARSMSRQATGTVRVSAFEIFGLSLIAPLLPDLQSSHPGIRVDLDLSDDLRDLAAGEADIAMRSAVRLSGGGLSCRRIGDERWGYYCSRGYVEAHGHPHSPDELEGHQVIGVGTEDFWPEFETWRRTSNIRNSIDFHHGSETALLAAVRNGFGIALLPALAAEDDAELVRCMLGPATGHGLWLVTHERNRDIAAVRLVFDFLADRLTRTAKRQAATLDP